MATVPMSANAMSRRTVLRAGGVCLALPLLESFGATPAERAPRRFVCVANPFGMLKDDFFPIGDGPDAKLPANLAALEKNRGRFTVFSNLDHGVNGGHGATHMFLSGVRSADAATMPDGNITLDQFLGRTVVGRTRFPVLNTAAGPAGTGGAELSWTRSGVLVPPIQKVSEVFRLLFRDDPPEATARQIATYDRRGSILDAVLDQAHGMEPRLSADDRRKFDQYLSSIREVETTLQQEKAWLSRPRPAAGIAEPRDGSVTQQVPILFDLVLLALQTDSTRVATIEVPGSFDTAAVGPEGSYHGFSHHGKDPTLMAGMRKIERFQMEQLSRFLDRLAAADLLDSTQVLFGSGMGDGSAHTNLDLPILVAGGGYRHRTHVVAPAEAGKKVPLCNLYLSMAQRFGVETDRFNRSTSTFTELG
jgi:hypothetical protein